MTKPISMFLNQGGKTYLEEAANYLEARGLTINDCPIIPYYSKNMGVHDSSGTRVDIEGWAYQILDGNLEPRDNEYLLRSCNIPPDTKLYMDVKGTDKPWECPKFIQTNRLPFLHYATKRSKVVAAKSITIHEKISSATIVDKMLGISSVAISGCWGWIQKGTINKELATLVEALSPDCYVVVCFDGDLTTNQGIMEAASRFKGELLALRPDLTVLFPLVPGGKGWDDFAVVAGQQGLIEALTAQGVEIVDVLPLPWLVEHFGVSLTDEKYPKLEQTNSNYLRLLRFPRWQQYRMDVSGDIYCGTEYYGSWTKLCLDFRMWLERSVCLGHGSKVVRSRVEESVLEWLESRKVAMVLELLRAQPPVSYDEARAAALNVVTKGFKVTGPMSLDENVETVLRMFRDSALRWGDARELDNIQWVWSIIGPSGCGKSMFSKFLFDGLADIGYRRVPKSVFTKSHSVKEEDEIRKAANSLVMALDDYNPSANTARDSENRVYTMTSMRTTVQREPYGKAPVEVMLRAVYFLSTTDKTRQFIRSSKDTGERRFIVMEGVGVDMVDGKLRVGKDVLKEAGLALMIWAANGAQGVGGGVAEEFSSKYVTQYVQEAPGVTNLDNINWGQLDQVMENWKREWSGSKHADYGCEHTCYRFVIRTMLIPALGGGRQWASSLNDIVNFVEECGAVRIGKARVNGELLPNGKYKDVMKDTVHEVLDKEAFISALRAVL